MWWGRNVTIIDRIEVGGPVEINLEADECLDASGLTCPEPIMLLHRKVRGLQGGAVLKIIATDPSTQRDVPKFCTFLGHELLASEEQEGSFFFYVRVAAASSQPG